MMKLEIWFSNIMRENLTPLSSLLLFIAT